MITPVLFIALVVQAVPTQELLQNAQSSLIAKEWKKAASILDALATDENASPEVKYDRGVAHYNLEEYDIAAKAFEDAMAASQEQSLRTYSAFNLGNAIFQQTMQDLEGTGTASTSDEAIDAMEQAKSQIKQALQSYRRAIAQDSTDLDARANGEFAWQMLQQLDQMQEQMEEQQKQQQEQQDQEQKQDEESAKEQEKDQEKQDQGDSKQEQDAKSEQSKQEQDGKQGEDSKEQNGEQSDQDPQEGEQSQQKQKDSEQSQQEQQNQQPQQKDGEQSKQEEQQKEQPQQQEGESSQQQPVSQQDDSSNEQDSNKQEESNTTEGELETTQEPTGEIEVPKTSKKEDGKRLSKDEAARLLQLIRDKEQQRRKALAARRAARRVPVEKDW
jgi:hypothetical protein